MPATDAPTPSTISGRSGSTATATVTRTSSHLRASWTTGRSTRLSFIVLDLRELEFIACSALRIIVSAHHRHAGHLIIVKGPAHVHRVFETATSSGCCRSSTSSRTTLSSRSTTARHHVVSPALRTGLQQIATVLVLTLSSGSPSRGLTVRAQTQTRLSRRRGIALVGPCRATTFAVTASFAGSRAARACHRAPAIVVCRYGRDCKAAGTGAGSHDPRPGAAYPTNGKRDP
jgi:hypothetical protein